MRIYSEVGEWYRLYNGGDGFNERMTYSLPDGHDIHCVAHWMLAAPEKEFFKVPKFMVIGEAQIPLFLLQTILRPDRYGQRGVIVVRPEWEAPEDEGEAEALPVAKSDAEAIAKAGRHWKKYYMEVAESWVAECNQARVAGGVPRKAAGFVARALKLAGIMDPGDTILATVTKIAPAAAEPVDINALVQAKVNEALAARGIAVDHSPAVPVKLSKTATEGRRQGRGT